jgi:hypothetical protein
MVRFMIIDIDELRDDLKKDCYGAFFGGSFGGGLIESFDIDNASDEELVEMAQEKGIDLKKYKIK